MIRSCKLLLGSFIVLLTTVSMTACDNLSRDKHQFHYTDIAGANFARDFDLISQNGERVTLSSFQGKIAIIFFGFTNCPDVCPTTLLEFSRTHELLGAKSDQIQVLFVTVDPERDTPERLKTYMQAFHPSFLALSGSIDQINAVTKEFKIIHQKVKGSSEGVYSIDHSAGSYVFDKNGRVRLFVPYGAEPQKLAEDILQLIES